MKTLLFVTVVSVLSATGAFAQGVAFDPYAQSQFGPYQHSANVGSFDQDQPAPQQVRQHPSLRITTASKGGHLYRTQRVGRYAKIARKKDW